MAIIRLGALRFAGLNSDVGSLPIDANLDGAIFDATDTTQKYVSDGTQWTEFVSGTGEANTGANVGVGTGTIFRDKIGVTLNFKSLIGGDNITVTDNADDVTITSTGTSPLTTKGDLYGFNTVDDRIPVGTDGQILSANSVNPIGVEWIDDINKTFQPAYQFAVTIPGVDIAVEVADNLWRVPFSFNNLASASAYVEIAPVGADLIVDLLKNSGPIATITIPAGSKSGTTTIFSDIQYQTVDEIGVDVTQVGSTTPGQNLKVQFVDGDPSTTKTIQFAVTATASDIGTGVQPDVWRVPTNITSFFSFSAYVQVAPVGSDLIFDVIKDGVVEATITIADGSRTGSTSVFNSGFLEFANEITVDVTQVGSTTPGQNLKVSLVGS